MDLFDLLRTALELPANAIAYCMSERLAAMFPERAVVEGDQGYFDLDEFAKAGLCSVHLRDSVHSQIQTSWEEHEGISKAPRNAWFAVEWNDQTFEALVLTWERGFHEQRYVWLLAESEEAGDRFFAAVSEWNAEIRDEVLVFDGGCWDKSEDLFRSIKGATFDNLVLQGTLKEEIRDDFARFFASRAAYEAHGVPWKRGVLFVGPPGNGKTHAVKALLNAVGQPCLYVKSFLAEHMTEHDCIRSVFKRARKSAPCILVLEDLDSLINPNNRSFFLNELDGFAANSGIVALATTNHPERLDPSILDRPSRFDRKYHFGLPAPAERLAYVTLWSQSLEPALRPTATGLESVVEQTDGFSFAYLKELFLSSMMRWIAAPGAHAMDAVLLEQAAALREQMVSAPPEPSQDDTPAGPSFPPWMRPPRRRLR
jgi:hypothetical protein